MEGGGNVDEWREGGMLMNGGRVECLGIEGGWNVEEWREG